MRGGYYRLGTKTTVEDCLTLSLKTLKDDLGRLFTEDRSALWGSVRWSPGNANITRILERRGELVTLRLMYTTTRPSGEKIENDYRVRMTYTVPNYGGRRWWFICPLSIGGKACGRRVGKLYNPPGALYFGCRHCYGLTYESTRESDLDRARRRLERAWYKLGKPQASGRGLWGALPSKPRYMHWETYDRLITQVQRLERAEMHALNARLGLAIDVPTEDEVNARAREHARAWLEDRLLMLAYEREQAERRRYPTLGEIAQAAGVPFDFAREARKRGLVREDKGRGTRRRRYRRKLATWLEKLYLLNQSGYTWEAIEDWTRRRFKPGHEDERRWPRGFRAHLEGS